MYCVTEIGNQSLYQYIKSLVTCLAHITRLLLRICSGSSGTDVRLSRYVGGMLKLLPFNEDCQNSHSRWNEKSVLYFAKKVN